MKNEEKKEKRDYTNLLLGITGVALIASHIMAYVGGYQTSWNICNNQMAQKEVEYIRRGYLTSDQINEVCQECFGQIKGS